MEDVAIAKADTKTLHVVIIDSSGRDWRGTPIDPCCAAL